VLQLQIIKSYSVQLGTPLRKHESVVGCTPCFRRRVDFKKQRLCHSNETNIQDDILTAEDMDNFLFATPSRTGYRSLKPQLLQHTKSPEAESKLRGHRKTLEVYVPLHVVALDEQHARHPVALTISSRSVRRIPHSDLLFLSLHIVRELPDRDFASGSAFCEQ